MGIKIVTPCGTITLPANPHPTGNSGGIGIPVVPKKGGLWPPMNPVPPGTPLPPKG